MGMQDFLLNQAMKWKMKDVPEAQRAQILELMKTNPDLIKKLSAEAEKNPELFKNISEEVERRVKGGESQMKALFAVRKKYAKELSGLNIQ